MYRPREARLIPFSGCDPGAKHRVSHAALSRLPWPAASTLAPYGEHWKVFGFFSTIRNVLPLILKLRSKIYSIFRRFHLSYHHVSILCVLSASDWFFSSNTISEKAGKLAFVIKHKQFNGVGRIAKLPAQLLLVPPTAPSKSSAVSSCTLQNIVFNFF